MNTGYIQSERAKVEQAKSEQMPTAEPLALYSTHSEEHYIDALKDDGTDDGANYNVCKLEYPAGNTLSEEQRAINAAEIVHRYNAFPELVAALHRVERELHSGVAEDGSEDGALLQEVRNREGDYLAALENLGILAAETLRNLETK